MRRGQRRQGVAGEELGFFLGDCVCRSWAKRKNEKRFEDMIPHLPQEEDAQTFFNEWSSRKQTVFRSKVCATQT
ncbi:hypothetical protein HanIR_Chr17g0894031 [Helianthus annuus]|nr:hypothetical protein HanIR_Chr17g0894031 [Helianthus annuus]